MDRRLAFLLVVIAVAGCATSGPPSPPEQPIPQGGSGIALREVASGLATPDFLLGDGAGHLVIVEQSGAVWRLQGGEKESTPLLDVRDKIAYGGEQGLLGFAFAPDYAASGTFYASYTDKAGDSVVERYHGGATDVVLKVDQPFANHNGGNIVFGPDGMLWLGLGDGGSGGDPQGNGQNPDTLLGSMLRLDVSLPTSYRSPPDNAFPSGGGRPEIWAKGLRNPWRFSFDRSTGDLWIGDVGQSAWEEIDHVPAPLHAGLNFGWNVMEGSHPYAANAAPFSPTTAPVAEYGHAEGCSVTGGYVYRGAAVPSLVGTYVFGDYCSGIVWGLTPSGGGWNLTRLLDTELSISSFGEDDAGEIYVVDHGGTIDQIVLAQR
jgi:glucose/arabinose dehydrogenase